MELAVISKEEALFQIEELPEMVRSMLGHDTVVFAARDDFGNVISSAVYSYSDAYRNEAWLVWFYTIPEYRFLNVASHGRGGFSLLFPDPYGISAGFPWISYDAV